MCIAAAHEQHNTRSLHSTHTTPSPSLACCPIGPKPVKALHSNDGANSIFGEMSLLDPIGKANATVSVPPHAYCDSFILPAESFRSIISTFPSFQKRVERIKREREQENAACAAVERDELLSTCSSPSSAAHGCFEA